MSSSGADPTTRAVVVSSRLVSSGQVRSGWRVGLSTPRYDAYLFSKIQPFLKGRICEIGSGAGRLTQYLAGHEAVTAVEPHRPSYLLALQRLAYQLNVQHVNCALEDCPNPRVPAKAYDTVLCISLLEHLEFDITALEIMRDLTAPAGHVVVVVPAGPRLFGRLDRSIGHLRRYPPEVLAGAFNEAGMEVTRQLAFNFPGMAAWWLLCRLLRCRRLPLHLLVWADRCVPVLQRAERSLNLPIGESILMIGRRP